MGHSSVLLHAAHRDISRLLARHNIPPDAQKEVNLIFTKLQNSQARTNTLDLQPVSPTPIVESIVNDIVEDVMNNHLCGAEDRRHTKEIIEMAEKVDKLKKELEKTRAIVHLQQGSLQRRDEASSYLMNSLFKEVLHLRQEIEKLELQKQQQVSTESSKQNMPLVQNRSFTRPITPKGGSGSASPDAARSPSSPPLEASQNGLSPMPPPLRLQRNATTSTGLGQGLNLMNLAGSLAGSQQRSFSRSTQPQRNTAALFDYQQYIGKIDAELAAWPGKYAALREEFDAHIKRTDEESQQAAAGFRQQLKDSMAEADELRDERESWYAYAKSVEDRAYGSVISLCMNFRELFAHIRREVMWYQTMVTGFLEEVGQQLKTVERRINFVLRFVTWSNSRLETAMAKSLNHGAATGMFSVDVWKFLLINGFDDPEREEKEFWQVSPMILEVVATYKSIFKSAAELKTAVVHALKQTSTPGAEVGAVTAVPAALTTEAQQQVAKGSARQVEAAIGLGQSSRFAESGIAGLYDDAEETAIVPTTNLSPAGYVSQSIMSTLLPRLDDAGVPQSPDLASSVEAPTTETKKGGKAGKGGKGKGTSDAASRKQQERIVQTLLMEERLEQRQQQQEDEVKPKGKQQQATTHAFANIVTAAATNQQQVESDAESPIPQQPNTPVAAPFSDSSEGSITRPQTQGTIREAVSSMSVGSSDMRKPEKTLGRPPLDGGSPIEPWGATPAQTTAPVGKVDQQQATKKPTTSSNKVERPVAASASTKPEGNKKEKPAPAMVEPMQLKPKDVTSSTITFVAKYNDTGFKQWMKEAAQVRATAKKDVVRAATQPGTKAADESSLNQALMEALVSAGVAVPDDFDEAMITKLELESRRLLRIRVQNIFRRIVARVSMRVYVKGLPPAVRNAMLTVNSYEAGLKSTEKQLTGLTEQRTQVTNLVKNYQKVHDFIDDAKTELVEARDAASSKKGKKGGRTQRDAGLQRTDDGVMTLSKKSASDSGDSRPHTRPGRPQGAPRGGGFANPERSQIGVGGGGFGAPAAASGPASPTLKSADLSRAIASLEQIAAAKSSSECQEYIPADPLRDNALHAPLRTRRWKDQDETLANAGAKESDEFNETFTLMQVRSYDKRKDEYVPRISTNPEVKTARRSEELMLEMAKRKEKEGLGDFLPPLSGSQGGSSSRNVSPLRSRRGS